MHIHPLNYLLASQDVTAISELNVMEGMGCERCIKCIQCNKKHESMETCSVLSSVKIYFQAFYPSSPRLVTLPKSVSSLGSISIFYVYIIMLGDGLEGIY